MLIMLSAFSLDTVAYAFVGQIIYVNSMNYVIFNMGPRLYEIQIVCEDPRAIERFIIEMCIRDRCCTARTSSTHRGSI